MSNCSGNPVYSFKLVTRGIALEYPQNKLKTECMFCSKILARKSCPIKWKLIQRQKKKQKNQNDWCRPCKNVKIQSYTINLLSFSGKYPN